MKKIKYFLLAILAVALFPKTVLAENNVSVKVKTNFTGEPVLEIPAEKDVTTVAQLKQAITNEGYDLNDYLVLNNMNSVASDSETVCGETLMCNGPSNGLFTNLYLMPIDHTARSYTLKSIPATDENVFLGLYEVNYEMFGSLTPSTCNDTFTLCTFIDTGMNFKAYDNVSIVYDYDENIKPLADAILEKLGDNAEFTTTDIEFLHYLNYGGSLANYTSSFKNQAGNTNFDFEIDERGGGDDTFETHSIGFNMFKYNGTIYAIKNFMHISAPHIIYVPTDTDDIVSAIEDRLETIFGDELMLTVSESADTINELLVLNGEDPLAEGGNDHYYIFTVTNVDSYMYDMEFYFMARKDSSKINNTVSFKSSDLITNVSVSTDQSIPLDTLVDVTHITEGAAYNDLIQALDIEEGEVFDIKLYSGAQDKHITELENGKFLVSIPVPEKYEGKDLIIYYKDEDGKITEYEVTVIDGYATFETDHFSVYTLALNPVQTQKTDNPPTGDKIMLYVSIFTLSAIGLIGVGIYIKKKNNN